ncbi:hypothetical protein [Amycolatopsis sp. FDAARGOS 1241]|uniref:hypothetical protein n=1 Tax=Amycolatopsis sp. FDAARGOS 1241 TaxID=2778070 RepID=UPI0019500462|nr:hypothetical protein [Amycolatopsis sp. FDAARGOS 1241]QRP46073.1 hypothetical protein I6J71_44695 [Amycolatopsis sp. FDAARGOS 1241]
MNRTCHAASRTVTDDPDQARLSADLVMWCKLARISARRNAALDGSARLALESTVAR